MVEDGDNTYGGRYVVNPSGGLISKGHPLGATGLAQCAELNWQVRLKIFWRDKSIRESTQLRINANTIYKVT
jgi:acetyl-CoA acetyltransferase